MKKVIVIGANGHTSQQIIPRLLEQDNIQLTLFSRNLKQLYLLESKRVRLFEGNANNIEHLKQAIQGQDIVISTMGDMDLDTKTDNIVKTMQELGVPRFIAISAGGIYNELPKAFNEWDKQMVGYTRSVNLRTAEIIERSSLQYTILRPVWLTDKNVENYELTQKGEVFKGTETSRASLGRFIAEIVENPQLYVGQNLGISQPNTDGNKPAAYR